MNEEGVSIIIPTLKRKVRTDPSDCPIPYETIHSRENGISYARNWGARRAKYNLLVFLDDDLILNPTVWNYVLSIKPREFCMYKLAKYPCTRVFSIHQEDFWNVGGFDERIRFRGEDRVFYTKARKKGYKCILLPHHLVKHIPHPPVISNRYLNLLATTEFIKFFVVHKRDLEANMLKMYLVPFKHRRFWDAFLKFLFTFYWLIRGN